MVNKSLFFLFDAFLGANLQVGLIRGYKRIQHKDNEKIQTSWGTPRDAITSKISLYVEEFKPQLSEVKITLYEGYETTEKDSAGGKYKDVNESMVFDAEVYNQWFDNLKAEIERKETLRK